MLFARLLLQDADLILLDEPFNAVDEATTADLLALMRDWRDQGRAVVVVLHDQAQVQAHFDRMLQLDGRRRWAWGATSRAARRLRCMSEGVGALQALQDLLFSPFAEFGFMRRALVAVVALSMGAAPLGCLLVLRRMIPAGRRDGPCAAARRSGRLHDRRPVGHRDGAGRLRGCAGGGAAGRRGHPPYPPARGTPASPPST